MGWKENKKKHDDYVKFVKEVLTGNFESEESYVLRYIQDYLKKNYGLTEKKYRIKLTSKVTSKEVNSYAYQIFHYEDVYKINVDVSIN